MKKLLFISLFLFIFLLGCKRNETNVFDNEKEIYGFEAISSITILNSFETQTNEPLLAQNSKYDILSLVTEEEITEINKYLSFIEQMLNDDKPITVINETSDKSGYNQKMTITTKDLNQNSYNYVIYYNETNTNENVEPDDNEQESIIDGIMIIGEKEYSILGKREIEENEVSIEFTSKIDDGNWVKVEQKQEDEETKFEITISENGVTSTTEMELEREDNNLKYELSFKQGGIEKEFEIEIDEDEENVIKIEVEDSISFVIKVFVTIDPQTNEVVYEYKEVNGNTYKKDRINPHDDKD